VYIYIHLPARPVQPQQQQHCVGVAVAVVVKARPPRAGGRTDVRHLADGAPRTVPRDGRPRRRRRFFFHSGLVPSPSSRHFHSVISSPPRSVLLAGRALRWLAGRSARGARGRPAVDRVVIVTTPVTVVRGKTMCPRHFPPPSSSSSARVAVAVRRRPAYTCSRSATTTGPRPSFVHAVYAPPRVLPSSRRRPSFWPVYMNNFYFYPIRTCMGNVRDRRGSVNMWNV